MASMRTKKRKARHQAGDGQSQVRAHAFRVLDSIPDERLHSILPTQSEKKDGLELRFWGEEPSDEDTSASSMTVLLQEFEYRNTVLRRSLSRGQVAQLLQIRPQSVSDMLAAGHLVGLRQGREWRFPSWQFDPDTDDGVVPGLDELARVFPGGVPSLTAWVLRRNVDLRDQRPLDLLKAGHAGEVVEQARVLISVAW